MHILHFDPTGYAADFAQRQAHIFCNQLGPRRVSVVPLFHVKQSSPAALRRRSRRWPRVGWVPGPLIL